MKQRLLKKDKSGNYNTQRNWDIFNNFYKGNLNYPPKFKFISQELLQLKNAKVIDIGCGYGAHLLRQIKKDHPDFQIEGLDLSPIAVEYNNSLGIKCTQGNVPKSLKKYKDYDVVIGTELLEHFNESDRSEIIKHAYRMLRKGGKAIFTVPDKLLPPGEGPGQEPFHLTCFNNHQLKALLNEQFPFISVISREFLVSDNPPPEGKTWGTPAFLIGVGYK